MANKTADERADCGGQAAVEREAGKDEILYWEEQGSDRSNWEQTMHVPMRFNRALFYNGNQFHSMSSWREFGVTKATARMTMVYFFHEL